jgi:hypothetical protein
MRVDSVSEAEDQSTTARRDPARLLSMDSGSGVAAMVRAAVSFETDLAMEVLTIGKLEDPLEDCVLEVCGKWLAYRIALHGGGAFLSAQLMDAGDEPDLLLRVRDDAAGWQTVSRVVAALEKHEIRSLARPIEIGTPADGDDCIVIA